MLQVLVVLCLRALPMACCLRKTQEPQGTSGAKGCKDNVDVCAQYGRMYAATHTLVVSRSRLTSFVSLVLVLTQNKEP